ncbi:hypothetical protein DM860_009439 [Cuscuta australis]|uniref:Leucine-rich repeat-containing N-terminal plant-type domain-containing protein n=1 Tax=Cuscuta australis TaxID=267555 RepID=A0A328DIF2_9ASTE|nr:hypothetical protein DM860_009439 [Cuscuta australis]
MFLLLILSFLLLQEEEAAVVTSNLDTDKQALLKFAVPHGLGWDPSDDDDDSICSSWPGVTCSSDRSRVVRLQLPGFGLCGPLPENTTIGRLDALEVLHLENNFLTGPIPPGLDLLIPNLKSLNLSNNGFSGPVPPCLLKGFPPSSFGGNPLLTTSGLPLPEVAIRRLSSSSSSGSKKKRDRASEGALWLLVVVVSVWVAILLCTPSVPVRVHATRRVLRHGATEDQWLVSWSDGSLDDATWEPVSVMRQHFPHLHLEDKVPVQGGRVLRRLLGVIHAKARTMKRLWKNWAIVEVDGFDGLRDGKRSS